MSLHKYKIIVLIEIIFVWECVLLCKWISIVTNTSQNYGDFYVIFVFVETSRHALC